MTRPLLVAVAAGAVAPFAAAQSAELINLGSGSAQASFGYDINAAGEIAGTVRAGLIAAAFRWTEAGGLTVLPRPQFNTPAGGASINAAGTVAGSGYMDVDAPAPVAMRWATTNQLEVIGFPSSLVGAMATGIADSGRTIGVTLGPPGVIREQGFRFENGSFTALDLPQSAGVGVSPSGVSAGWQAPAGLPEPRLWNTPSGIVQLPVPAGTTSAVATDVADTLGAIGTAATADGLRAVAWTPAGEALPALGVLDGGTRSVGLGTNGLGDAVGFCDTPDGRRAFIWSEPTGMVDLNTLLDAADAAVWTLTQARAINDARQIAGFGLFDDGSGTPVTRAFRLDVSAVFGVDDCPADLVPDGTLDIDDVLAFLDAFASGDPAADLSPDSVLDIDDVLAFLDAFAAGCG